MRSRLRESYIGAMIVAFLLSGAIRALIKVVEGPVANVFVRAINFIQQRSYPDSSRLRLPDVPQLGFNLLYIATAGTLFLIGYLIAFWLYPASTERGSST